MNVPIPEGPEQIMYQGKMIEVFRQKMKAGEKMLEFEYARRSPGVRLLITDGKKIFLTKEYRPEIKSYDYRLPGGKVYDKLTEYNAALANKVNIIEAAAVAAKKECVEEAGIIANSVKHIHTSNCGASVTWDLFYFLVNDFKTSEHGQELETGEVIHPDWYTLEEVKQMCLSGQVGEDRSVAVLLRYILKP